MHFFSQLFLLSHQYLLNYHRYSIMAQQVRKGKYSEFNPEPSKWRHNKRNLDQATEALEVMVAKNYSKLALPVGLLVSRLLPLMAPSKIISSKKIQRKFSLIYSRMCA